MVNIHKYHVVNYHIRYHHKRYHHIHGIAKFNMEGHHRI